MHTKHIVIGTETIVNTNLGLVFGWVHPFNIATQLCHNQRHKQTHSEE
jgi:hypothetical protein